MLREYYYRNLPHLLPIGATFFVTFRLKGSIPKSIIDKLAFERDEAFVEMTFRKGLSETERQSLKYAIEKKYWQAFNDVLDTIKEGPHHLKIPELAQIVVDRLIKGSSAKFCNDWLKEHKMPILSPFWTPETFDRYIRNQKHEDATIDYILNNPVKVGICEKWEDYPFAYVAQV